MSRGYWTRSDGLRLELEHAVLGPAEVAQVSRELALVSGRLLLAADGLHHAGRTADVHHVERHGDALCGGGGVGVGGRGRGDELGELVLGEHTVLVVEARDDFDAAAEVRAGEGFEVLQEEGVLLGLREVDELDGGSIVGVAGDLLDDLVHGGDAGAASEECEVAHLAGDVLDLVPGALEVYRLTDLEVL